MKRRTTTCSLLPKSLELSLPEILIPRAGGFLEMILSTTATGSRKYIVKVQSKPRNFSTFRR